MFGSKGGINDHYPDVFSPSSASGQPYGSKTSARLPSSPSVGGSASFLASIPRRNATAWPSCHTTRSDCLHTWSPTKTSCHAWTPTRLPPSDDKTSKEFCPATPTTTMETSSSSEPEPSRKTLHNQWTRSTTTSRPRRYTDDLEEHGHHPNSASGISPTRTTKTQLLNPL